MADLTRLNPAERDVLALLARGHTAKSVATLTGRSVGSVNERLREARRKAGVGSSRELARLLAQESRDEQSGVGVTGENVPAHATAARRAGGRIAKGLAMTLLLFVLVALVQQQPAAPADPAIEAALGPVGQDPRSYHDRLTEETRDPAWANAAEAALRRRYAAIQGLDPASLHVRCAATLCEIYARFLTHGDAATNTVMQVLQGTGLHDDLKQLGFADGAQAFGGTGSGAAARNTVVAFWTKAPHN